MDTPTVVATASETKTRALLIRSNDQVDVAILGVEKDVWITKYSVDEALARADPPMHQTYAVKLERERELSSIRGALIL